MEISGVKTNIDDSLKKYINKKIGRLDRFMPRHARKSVHTEVFIKERSIKTKKEYTCEVVIFLPNETIATKESTVNAYAAVDIVETKLKNQLKKYKDKNTKKRVPRRLLAKIKARRTL